MKKLRKYLAVIALASASAGAFAFAPQNPDPNLTLYGNLNGSWVPVSGSYNCIEIQDLCVAQFKNNQVGGEMIYSREGKFIR